MSLEPLVVDYDDRDLLAQAPLPRARPAAGVGREQDVLVDVEQDLTDHLAGSATLQVLHNPDLKVYSRVRGVGGGIRRTLSAGRGGRGGQEGGAAAVEVPDGLRTLQNATGLREQPGPTSGLEREQRHAQLGRLRTRRTAGRASFRVVDEHRRAAASSAKSRADAAAAKVDDVQAQLQNLEADLTDELHALHAEWQGKAANIVPVEITAKRTQIRVTDLRLVWIPVG